MMITDEELDRVKEASHFRDETNEFVVPPFIFKDKKVKFPNLPQNKGI